MQWDDALNAIGLYNGLNANANDGTVGLNANANGGTVDLNAIVFQSSTHAQRSHLTIGRSWSLVAVPTKTAREVPTMPQSLSQIWVHLIFSTKERRPFLQHPEFREAMFKMLAHHVKQSDCLSASVGGATDHVHLLITLSRTITLAKLVEVIKTETSRWAKTAAHGAPNFSWQAGYGAFSVSQSQTTAVDKYIRDQDQHHAKLSYQDEFRNICRKHGLEIDERYVWD